jgi:hypothetical protein
MLLENKKKTTVENPRTLSARGACVQNKMKKRKTLRTQAHKMQNCGEKKKVKWGNNV